MRKLSVFNHVTLDGYFTGENGDFSWAHRDGHDKEWNKFGEENASKGGTLLFGRVTYDMMAKYWPTPEALRDNPIIAKQMNERTKMVFSRTLRDDDITWDNATLVKGDLAGTVRWMKEEEGGPDMTIIGSGSIVAQLAGEGLIDEYQIVVNPVVLGKGRTMFDHVRNWLSLEPKKTRTFHNGNVFLCYEPASA